MDSYIQFDGAINKDSYSALIAALEELRANPLVTRVVLLFSSPGGAITYGLSLASYIQNYPKTIWIHATNDISSIANVIYLAGKERSAEAHAKFFMHGAATGYGSFDIAGLREEISGIEVDNKRIARFVSANTDMTLDAVVGIMEMRESMNVETAIDRKIVEEVKSVIIPAGSDRKVLYF